METDPKKIKNIGNGLIKPEDVEQGTFGHATGLLRTLAENYQLGEVNNNRIKNIISRIREKIQKGILPDNTLDLLGYDEEPEDWRE